MANVRSLHYRYFIYSSSEEALRVKTHGANVVFGEVSVRGVPKRYTSIVKDMKDDPADAIVLIKGDIRHIHYVPPAKMLSRTST
jgi:hypothetical protein